MPTPVSRALRKPGAPARHPTPPPPAAWRAGSRFLCRVSGLPVDGVEALRAERTLAVLGRLERVEARIAAESETVSERLHAAVGAAETKNVRNRLLRLRRDLYNGRAATEARLAAADEALPAAEALAVRAHAALLEERDRLAEDAAALHDEEAGPLRAEFERLLGDELFRRGLIVSSPSLFGAMERWRGAGEADPRGRDAKTERGLLRYLTRAAMKATPFATFCSILTGRLDGDGDRDGSDDTGPLRLTGDPRPARSQVRLDKRLCGILLDHLKERDAVRVAWPVEPNPTLGGEPDGRLLFLTRVEGREVFQRLPHNPVLDRINALFAGGAAPALGAVIDALCADPRIEAEPEQARAYCDRLLEIGYLRFRTGIAEQDAEWDRTLRALLEGIDDEHARAAVELLDRLREGAEAYADADPERRAALVTELRGAIGATLETMGLPPRPGREVPFYEDATAADAEARLAGGPGTRRMLDAWTRWVELTVPLAFPRPDLATMRRFHERFYGDEVPAVPLLRFYEDYHREHLKAHLEKEARLRAGETGGDLEGYDAENPFGDPLVGAIQAARRALAERVRERWRAEPEAEEIRLTADEVAEAIGELPPAPPRARSVGVFGTLAPGAGPDGDPALVLTAGSYTTGFGKFFSRFLSLVPEETLEAVREENRALTPARMAEITGDSHFNANLHPRLLEWEISYPTGEPGEAEAQLRSAELAVERDPDDPHALRLRHVPTGEAVVPVDLSFQNPRLRPPLFQLLIRFAPPAALAAPVPESMEAPRRRTSPDASPDDATGDATEASSPVEGDEPSAEATPTDDANDASSAEDAASAPNGGGEKPAPRVVVRPRVTFEGHVVLGRRRWSVPFELLPQREPGESAGDFFVRVDRWRRAEGIPESAYVRINVRRQARPAAPEEAGATDEEEPTDDDVEAEAEAAAETANEGEDAEDGTSTDEGDEAEGARRTAVSRDLVKPQFVDFANPLLVALLGRMGAGIPPFDAVFEERLPDAGGLPEQGGRRFSTELVLQVHRPDAEALDG